MRPLRCRSYKTCSGAKRHLSESQIHQAYQYSLCRAVQIYKTTTGIYLINLYKLVLISCSLIPSKTNTVKPYDVLPIPKLVKHRTTKKIKIIYRLDVCIIYFLSINMYCV